MKKPTATDLQQIFEPLSEVPEAELTYLIEHSRFFQLKEDEYLFKAGDTALNMHLIVAGKLRIFAMQNGQQQEYMIVEKGAISGLLPYSRLKEVRGYGQALEDCWILAFPKEKMPDLIRENYHLTEELVHLMSSRIREFTTFQQQNEKMMALGKLSAGLAHELNNPASAIVRSSKELQSHLRQQPGHFKRVMAMQVSPDQVDKIANLLFERLGQVQPRLGMMQRQQLEDELSACLTQFKVAAADEIAENLVEYNFSCDELRQLRNISGEHHFSATVHWINESLITEKMVREIEDASSRIAELVSSVKNFTQMDRSQDMAPTDIHQSLDNTLLMLKHKFKKNNVSLEREFAEDLPMPEAMVNQLNQVWTNLIDNALDALEDSQDARLAIKTSQEHNHVKIRFRDNGPGIPEEVVNRIWDPFFTTKDVGKGNGLGLDVVKRIIERHHGSIQVKSKAGNTEFEVCLPLKH